MSNNITIKVADLIGSPLCISSDDGQKVYDKIEELLNQDKSVTISFDRVSTLISLFLNVAIGQLYGTFTEDKIRSLVEVEGLEGDDLEMLKRVVDNAKKYFADPEHYDKAWKSEGVDNEE